MKSKNALLVLPSGVTDKGEVSFHSRRRADKALEIQNRFDYVILCGKYSTFRKVKPKRIEAEAMLRYMKIPRKKVLVEKKSTDTILNFLNARSLMLENNIKECTFVTSESHGKRALYIAKKAVPEVKFRLVTVKDGVEKKPLSRFREKILLIYTKYLFRKYEKMDRSKVQKIYTEKHANANRKYVGMLMGKIYRQ